MHATTGCTLQLGLYERRLSKYRESKISNEFGIKFHVAVVVVHTACVARNFSSFSQSKKKKNGGVIITAAFIRDKGWFSLAKESES